MADEKATEPAMSRTAALTGPSEQPAPGASFNEEAVRDVRRQFDAKMPGAPTWYADVVIAFLVLLRDGEAGAPAAWLRVTPAPEDAALEALASLLVDHAQRVGPCWWSDLVRAPGAASLTDEDGGWSRPARKLLRAAGLDPARTRAPPGTAIQLEFHASPHPQPAMVALRTPLTRTLLVTLDGADKRR